MHVPDGLISLNPITSPGALLLILSTIISIIIILYIFKEYDKEELTKRIPLLAMFIAAAVVVQFIELPLPVAVCTHIYLITLIALYDLKTSMIVYTFVTIIQALYGEGGITTLGLDVLNLAIIAPLLCVTIYKTVEKFDKKIAIFLAGFLTVTLVGALVSIEYAAVGAFPLSYGVFLIIPVEAFVGVLEGIVAVIVMEALKVVKPELVPVLAQENN